MFVNYDWWRRLVQLSSGQDDPRVPGVTHVNIVQDSSWRGSRERGPLAQHAVQLAAGGAGIHGFFEIRGSDTMGTIPIKLLHRLRTEVQMSSIADGLISVALADSLTTASRIATTPAMLEVDGEGVVPQFFIGSIATANLPATRIVLPRTRSVGQTGATPLFPTSVVELETNRGMPVFVWGPSQPPSFFLFHETPNQAFHAHLAWQTVRS